MNWRTARHKARKHHKRAALAKSYSAWKRMVLKAQCTGNMEPLRNSRFARKYFRPTRLT